MDFKDQVLTCADCQAEFTFTGGEQQFYDQKGFSSPPKRCKNCRELRRRDRPAGGGGGRGRTEPSEYRSPAFRDSDPSRGRGGASDAGLRGSSPVATRARPPRRAAVVASDEYRAPSFSPRPIFPMGPPGPEEEIDEELDSIGNQLHPPTRPAMSPTRQPAAPSGPPPADRRDGAGGGGSGGGRSRTRATHEITCAECGKVSRVPFKPQSGKPVFCRECYQVKKDGPEEEAVG
jgi:CxxC-x17-CxxC domain-containing protein